MLEDVVLTQRRDHGPAAGARTHLAHGDVIGPRLSTLLLGQGPSSEGRCAGPLPSSRRSGRVPSPRCERGPEIRAPITHDLTARIGGDRYEADLPRPRAPVEGTEPRNRGTWTLPRRRGVRRGTTGGRCYACRDLRSRCNERRLSSEGARGSWCLLPGGGGGQPPVRAGGESSTRPRRAFDRKPREGFEPSACSLPRSRSAS